MSLSNPVKDESFIDKDDAAYQKVLFINSHDTQITTMKPIREMRN